MKAVRIHSLLLTTMLLFMGLLSTACGPSDATGDPDDPLSDGDGTETPDDDDDDDNPLPDGDTNLPDGDDPDEDGDLDTETEEQEWDREKIEVEEEAPDPCEGTELAACFTNAPAGTEGYRCQGTRRLFCTVTEPQAPTCRSECRCQVFETCEGTCVDEAFDGNAACGPAPDGDLDAEDEPDGDEIDGDEDNADSEDETPADGDEIDADEDLPEGESDSDDEVPADGDETDGDLPDEDGDLDDAEPWVCTPDAFEINNTPGQAALIDEGLTEDLTVCNGEFDWYSFFAPDGATLSVRMDLLDEALDDLNLFLKDADGTTLASSATAEAFEEVNLLAPVTGTYYIYIRGGATATARYNLDLSIVVTVDGDQDLDLDETESVELQESEIEKEEYYVCPDDYMEENDTRDEAIRVTSTTYNNLHRCPSDDDWYELPLIAGDHLSVEVLFTHAEGDLDVYLYDANNIVRINSIGTTDNEIISNMAIVASGTWKIRVFGKTASVDNEYTLVVRVVPTTNCVDDSFENAVTGENDGPDQATTSLLPASSYDLHLCPYDPDWYEFHLEPGDTFYTKALFSHSDGNLDLHLWTADGLELLAESATNTDDELIIYESDRTLDVHLEVFGYSEYDIPYTLEVDWGVLSICMEDSYEENDSFDDAYSLDMGFYDLMLCQDDTSSFGDARDYWAFDLDQYNKLDLEATYTAPSIDMDFRLFKPDRTTVAVVPVTQDGRKTWTMLAPQTGLYYLQTRKYNQTQDEPYQLSVNICPEDQYEENDAINRAAYLTPGVRNLALCRGDQDWFSVNVESGQTLTCTIQFINSQGDLDLALRNGNGEILVESATPTNNEQVSYTAPYADTYYLHIYGFGDETQNIYSMILSVQ